MSSERNFSISIILFFLLFMGGLVYQNIRFQQRVKAEYAGKLIKLDSKYPLTFQVEQTSGEWWFGNSEIYLYGTLFVEKPQNASYTGYSPGSPRGARGHAARALPARHPQRPVLNRG